MTAPDFLTIDAVAARLGIQPDTLRRKRANLEADLGFPPPVPWCARPLRWRADLVAAWLERQAHPQAPAQAPAGAFRPYLVHKAQTA